MSPGRICRMLILEQIAQKEKSHVVDYHCNSSNPVAARLFGWEHKSKLPENRQLDPYSARYCPHPNRSKRAGDHLVLRFFENRRGSLSAVSPGAIYVLLTRHKSSTMDLM